LDVTAAFLNGELEEHIYMQQPEDFHEGGPGMAWRLHRAVYGLKQASRAWYTTLSRALRAQGFEVSQADAGLFIISPSGGSSDAARAPASGRVGAGAPGGRGEGVGSGSDRGPRGPVYLLVHVDDMLVGGSGEHLSRVKRALSVAFKVTDKGEVRFHLGMEITRDRAARTLRLTQTKYTAQLQERYGMEAAHPRAVPMSTSSRLKKDEGEPLDPRVSRYAKLVGGLLFLAVNTRPDISFAVGVLTRFMGAPTLVHWHAAKDVLRYLAATPGMGLQFGGGQPAAALSLQGFSDADYGGDLDSRRSTTGFVYLLNGAAISWGCKLQSTVAVSTAEAEYMATASAIKEGLWGRQVLPDLGVSVGTVPIGVDSEGAIKMLKHPIAWARSKHIDVQHHFARECVVRGEVELRYVHTGSMVADFLTKPLSREKFEQFRKDAGV
jgi:hypothetical protein